MLVDNKSLWIYWKNSESSYAYANRKVLIEPPRKIGSSISAVSSILANSEEQKELMADIISVSPSSQDWNKMLSNYWNSISQDVAASGKKLEIGFMYDIDSISKQKYIQNINNNIKSEKGKLTTDEDLKNFIDNQIDKAIHRFNNSILAANKLTSEKVKVDTIRDAYKLKYSMIIAAESQRYKVGTPISTVDYMLYRYCLVYRDVANELSLSDKSSNIRLYLHSEADIAKYKKVKVEKERNRMSTYLKAIKDVSNVENILYAMGYSIEIPENDTDKFVMLDEKSKEVTDKFIRVANSGNLKIIGLIEKYIKYSILHRLDGSTVIVDGSNPSLILGNNINEAITWFNNKVNNEKVNEYTIRFKTLNS